MFRRLRQLSSQRKFLAYWVGGMISMSGTWVQILALNWVVLGLQSSPTGLAWNSLLLGGPSLVMAFFGGSVADRRDRRWIFTYTQLTYVLISLVLAWLIETGRIQLWHVLLSSFVGSITSAYDAPVQQSLLADLVDRDSLQSAVALDQMSFNLTRFVGPAVGAVILGRFGAAGALMACAASSLLQVCVVWVVAPARVIESRPKLTRKVLLAGLTHILEEPSLRHAFGITLLASALLLPLVSILTPAFIKSDLAGTSSTLATFMAASGAASAAGALATVWATEKRRLTAQALALVAAGAALGAMVLAHRLAPSLACYAVASFFTAFVLTSNQIGVQHHTKPELRGRVLSLTRTLSRGLVPLSALVLGFASDRAGLLPVMGVAAGLLALSGMLSVRGARVAAV